MSSFDTNSFNQYFSLARIQPTQEQGTNGLKLIPKLQRRELNKGACHQLTMSKQKTKEAPPQSPGLRSGNLAYTVVTGAAAPPFNRNTRPTATVTTPTA